MLATEWGPHARRASDLPLSSNLSPCGLLKGFKRCTIFLFIYSVCVHQWVYCAMCAGWCYHVLAREHREVGKQPSGIISHAYPWDPGLNSGCQSRASPCIQRAISPVPFSDLSTFRFPFHLSCGSFSSVFYGSQWLFSGLRCSVSKRITAQLQIMLLPKNVIILSFPPFCSLCDCCQSSTVTCTRNSVIRYCFLFYIIK